MDEEKVINEANKIYDVDNSFSLSYKELSRVKFSLNNLLHRKNKQQ